MSLFNHHKGKPKPPSIVPLGVSVRGSVSQEMLPGAVGVLTPDTSGPIQGVNEGGRIRFDLPYRYSIDWGLNLHVTCDGYNDFDTRINCFDNPSHSWDIGMETSTPTPPPVPPPPSRDEACTVKMHFQGLFIDTQAYGRLPWFSAALTSMPEAELPNIIKQLQSAGDTHIPIDWAWDYGEPGQPYGTGQLVPPCDLRYNPDAYLKICDMVIASGAKPIFVFSGEGQAGYDDLTTNFSNRVNALRQGYDRLAYGPIAIWYDGVWPAAWSVSQMESFLQFARGVIGDQAYLMMMFAGGPEENQYLVIKGIEDYNPGGMIYEYLDIWHCTGYPDQTQGEALGQIASRMLGPAFVCNVPGYSGENCSGKIFYPQHGCRRGPLYWGWIEWDEYGFVRGWVTPEKIEADRQRMRNCGVVSLG